MQALYIAGDWLRQRARERAVAEGKLAPHRAVGQHGEDFAHRYLRRLGFRVIGRNWRTRSGSAEIDIVAWDERPNENGTSDGGTLIFVEVKTRGSEAWNAPERQIDLVKRRNMARGAAEFVRRFAQGQEKVRFDVVSVVLGADAQSTTIRHWPDAFLVDGLETRRVEPLASRRFVTSGGRLGELD